MVEYLCGHFHHLSIELVVAELEEGDQHLTLDLERTLRPPILQQLLLWLELEGGDGGRLLESEGEGLEVAGVGSGVAAVDMGVRVGEVPDDHGNINIR